MYLKPDIISLICNEQKEECSSSGVSAGLLRFFEDETKGIKIKPEVVLGITGGLIGISLLIRILFPV